MIQTYLIVQHSQYDLGIVNNVLACCRMSFQEYVQCASFFGGGSMFWAFCLMFLNWTLSEALTFLYLPLIFWLPLQHVKGC
jgi:hypothetical protein